MSGRAKLASGLAVFIALIVVGSMLVLIDNSSKPKARVKGIQVCSSLSFEIREVQQVKTKAPIAEGSSVPVGTDVLGENWACSTGGNIPSATTFYYSNGTRYWYTLDKQTSIAPSIFSEVGYFKQLTLPGENKIALRHADDTAGQDIFIWYGK